MEDNQPQGRVNPTNSGPKNPSAYFAEWNSTKQCFSYYDKPSKKDVLLPLPFIFIPLSRGVCIKGYDEPNNTSLISNEVKEIENDVFTVKAYNNITKKSHVAFVGTWEEIKDKVKAAKGSWTESLHVAVKDDTGKLILANLQLNGSGMKHWFEFLKTVDIWSTAVCVKEFTNEKKGAVNYHSPVFSAVKIKKETDIEAAVLQKEILAYLDVYYAKNAQNVGQVQNSSQNGQNTANSASNQSGQHPAFTANSNSGMNTEKIDEANFGEDDNLPF